MYHKPRAERIKSDSIIESFDESGKKLLWSGKLIDYSATGACFLTEKKFQMGELVKARIRIFNRGCLEISGKIVRGGIKGKLNLYAIKYDSLKEINPTGEKKKIDEYY